MVTLINAFIVPADQEVEFTKCWQLTTEVYSRADGFIEAYLHLNVGVGDATFRFMSISYWASAEAAERVRKAYPPSEERLTGVQGYPAIFEAVNAARHRDKKQLYATP